MLIDLDPETEKLLQHELDAGRFPDAAALLSVALKHFLIAKQFGDEEAQRLAVLRAELDHADEQIGQRRIRRLRRPFGPGKRNSRKRAEEACVAAEDRRRM